MDSNDIQLAQYESLREEIKRAKQHMFSLMGFITLLVPAIKLIEDKISLESLMIFVPVIITAVSFIYLSLQHEMYRCGLYIKEVLEKSLFNKENYEGWETWLENGNSISAYDYRRADKYLHFSFIAICLIYFLISFALSSDYLAQMDKSKVLQIIPMIWTIRVSFIPQMISIFNTVLFGFTFYILITRSVTGTNKQSIIKWIKHKRESRWCKAIDN